MAQYQSEQNLAERIASVTFRLFPEINHRLHYLSTIQILVILQRQGQDKFQNYYLHHLFWKVCLCFRLSYPAKLPHQYVGHYLMLGLPWCSTLLGFLNYNRFMDTPSCQDKMVFDTKDEAENAATVAEFQRGSNLKVYKCRECHLWHLSSNYDYS